MRAYLAGIILLSAIQFHAGAAPMCEAVNLKCEHLENPLGLDAAKPRLYWQMKDARRGARQTAYQVVVASAPELLAENKADVWDSGRVESDESAHIVYGGPELTSLKKYHWAVRVWDMENKAAAWSRPAFWEMGLLKKDDWQAKWVGREYTSNTMMEDVSGIKWIWYPEGDPVKTAGNDKRYFRTEFEIPAGKQVDEAMFYPLADNLYHAHLNGKPVRHGGGWKSLDGMDIKAHIQPGKNTLSIMARNENGPAGLAVLLRITFSDKSTLRIVSDDKWQAAKEVPKDWTSVAPKPQSWTSAKVLIDLGGEPWGKPWVAQKGGPAALLRKSFKLEKKIKTARVFVTALGSYRLHINGKKVGNDILTPDWTDYLKRVMYQTYDVTDLMKSGENAVGAIVGDGWYASGLGWGLQRFCFGAPPLRFLLQLHIEHEDGTSQVIASDASWKSSQSPILHSEIYAGETYDARAEQKGWDSPGFDDSKWEAVLLPDTASTLPLAAQSSPPIRVTKEIKPLGITTPAPETYVYDLGQNMVGWARLKVKGPAGTKVQMRFAEILKPDGNIYTENLRKAEATDRYILRGEGEEVYEPHFTYHGFRYVEVTGYPGKPGLDAITGCVFHTAAPDSGRFETDSELVNKIWLNTFWGQRGNLHSVPTDCPQRDERLGWMGDAQAFWRTACYNMDLASFTHKWMRDVREAQSKEGGFSDVAPRVVDLADGAPAWGDAGIIVPYAAYRQYGDKRLVEENWEAMEKWVKYIADANPDMLWMKRRNNDFGDWVPANSETDKGLIATCYWAYDCRLMEEMAQAIGREQDAAKYRDMFGRIKDAFVKKFIAADGKIANGSQTCYVLPLHFGLVPDEKREIAVKHLVDDITSRGGHLSTGFLGSTYLMPVLCDNGRADVAYKLLLNEDFPSWGYMVRKGATTIWERWNGDTGDPGMNSFNHYCYGAVSEWMYRYAAGIDTSKTVPGFKRIVIKPHVDTRLKRARGEYDSVYGEITSEWKHGPGGSLELNVQIPANTLAEIHVPGPADKITESGKPVAAPVKLLREEGGHTVYEAPAGEYGFLVGKTTP